MKHLLLLLTLATVQTACTQQTIRAQFPKQHKAIQSFLRLEPLLNKHGLYAVEENPDVIFVYNSYDIQSFSTDVPIIILERNAPASLKNRTRHTLSLPHVKAVFKNKMLRPKKFNNKKQIMHIYCYHVVNKYAKRTQAKRDSYLSQEELDKVHAVMWDLPMSPFSLRKFSELRHYQIDYTQERPIDVFFAGAVYSENHEHSIRHALMGWHRSRACEALKNIPDINALVLEGHPLPFDEYLKTMQKSKIVVSPWAWGEWAFRDYEAIHSGAILVKPDTSFVESTPDIYQNYDTYVPCKPDFSDLPEIITGILKNYDTYTTMRKSVKDLVVNSWDHENIVKNFVDHVKRALE